MIDRRERLVAYLVSADGWVTAGELADQLAVTTRSVRSYVTAIKAMAHPLEVIASSTSGYRLNRDAYSAFQARRRDHETESPRDRMYHVVRSLSDAVDGLDIYALAEALFVSESTIEADLRKLRSELDGSGLILARRENTVSLRGSERELRRLISRLFRDEGTQGFLELDSIEREFGSADLRAFKTDLIAMLDGHGYLVNEYGINNVLLHLAIAVDRQRRAAGGDGPTTSIATPPRSTPIRSEFDGLVRRHFDVALPGYDVEYLEKLLTTRVVTRGHRGMPIDSIDDDQHTARAIALVRRVVERVGVEYLVDLDNEEFIVRLSLHVGNLIARARDQSYSRNPMSRSLKTSYPMIYELAVFMASEVQRSEGISINDDEISYIAMHVGSYLERQSRREERVTVALVCPNYYDIQLTLRTRLESILGDEIQVETVITRTDVDWEDLATDLVLTTIGAGSMSDSVVVIQPFLTDGDIESIRRAIGRVRRIRHRSRLKGDLLLYFDPALFLRNFHTRDEVSMIRALGDRMIQAGVIDQTYVAGAIERELMSSTAFTDNLAVPHSMTMSAARTAMCIVVNETPMDWGESRVNVVALIAFSSSDRSTFQSVFDQFVSVFADRDEVQQLIRRSVDFPSFIEEIVHAIDT